MRIYPTLELMGGRCVSLDKGKMDAPMVWHVDPVEVALSFARAGAEWMHLTDFDAIAGSDRNEALVERIIRGAGIPVQLGGGFRTLERVDHWIGKGAGRVCVGTLAARNPDLLRRIARLHPDQIVLAVDVWQGRVMTDGWTKTSAFAPEEFLDAFADLPLAGIVVTDIANDAGESEGKMGMIAGLARHARSPVIASGVVRTVDDISRLAHIPNISGALVGRALFRRTVALDEALLAARRGPQRVAEFI